MCCSWKLQYCLAAAALGFEIVPRNNGRKNHDFLGGEIVGYDHYNETKVPDLYELCCTERLFGALILQSETMQGQLKGAMTSLSVARNGRSLNMVAGP